VLPFPFSDLSSSKRRPALVVAIASADIIAYKAGDVKVEKLKDVASIITDLVSI